MGFYRFMASRYMDKTLGGELRLTSLSYYRLMEKLWDDEWIGDSQEGQAFTTIDHLDLPAGQDVDGARGKLEAARFISGSGVNLKINGLTNIAEENGFILSFAYGDLRTLKDEMLRDGYDSCVRFQCIESLACIMYERGVDGSGRKISDFFHAPVVSQVSYEANEHNLRDVDGFVSGSAFVKRVMYKEQKEFRIFFALKAPMDVDFVEVSLVLPVDSICEEFRNVPISESIQKPDLKVVEDPLARLGEIRNMIHSAEGGDSRLKIFNESLGKDALLAYWQLRKEHRSNRLDTFFCMKVQHGGTMTHFVYLLDKYFSTVKGMSDWEVAGWLYELQSSQKT